MREIAFQKWEATGNDFLFVDSDSQTITAEDVEPREIARACDRSQGFGADGVVFFGSGADSVVAMTVVNSDGSRGDMCGNALRCLAKILHQKTGANTHAVSLAGRLVEVKAGAGDAEVMMGPVSDIPGTEKFGDLAALSGVTGRKGHLVSFGNPHYVTPVKSIPSDWVELGRALQEPAQGALGTGGINAGFVAREADPEGVRELRVFERGAGPTKSCGSGACAASAVLEELCGISPPHALRLTGGVLTIGREGQSFTLRGPANLEFRDIWRIEN